MEEIVNSESEKLRTDRQIDGADETLSRALLLGCLHNRQKVKWGMDDFQIAFTRVGRDFDRRKAQLVLSEIAAGMEADPGNPFLLHEEEKRWFLVAKCEATSIVSQRTTLVETPPPVLDEREKEVLAVILFTQRELGASASYISKLMGITPERPLKRLEELGLIISHERTTGIFYRPTAYCYKSYRLHSEQKMTLSNPEKDIPKHLG